MSKTDPIASFSTANQLKIICPIFGVESEVRVCLHLRDELWAGRKKDVRRGCQACLHDSKCPIVVIVQETFRTGEDPGYFSREPRVVSIKDKHLDRIQRVLVQDKTLNDYGVPDNERLAIAAVNRWDAKLKGRVPGHKLEELPSAGPARKPAEKPIEAPKTDLIEAAATGDLTAAINEATGGAA